MVTGTTGDDEITLSGQTGDVTVDMLAGDDLLHVSSYWSSVDATATIHGDEGEDTLHLFGIVTSATGSGFSGTIVTENGSLVLTDTWDGIERLDVNAADATTGGFVTGESDDELDLSATQIDQVANIATNGGDDHVILSEGYGSGTIDAGAGDDVVDMSSNTSSGSIDIFGGAGDDVIRGLFGGDTMRGGGDDDTYYVSTFDVVVELADEGTDTVYTNRDYTLPDHVENLIYFAFHFTPFSADFTGNALDNHIVGNGGEIDGGAGADIMENGQIYHVDNVGDVVIETGAGTGDEVLSSITYTLGDNLENLYLKGGDAIDGTGNGLGNIIVGNDAANTLRGLAGDDKLDGGLGADTLIGGDDDDQYQLREGDVIVELAGEGEDTVISWVASYTMADNVERLFLNNNAITGIGNALDNYIADNASSNDSDNFIDGGAGADTMVGWDGDDTYVVDNPLDQVVEQSTNFFPNAGNDTVRSSISYTLAPNVENLVLTGLADLDGTGNNLDNVIDGNGGDNVLDGLYGNDTMRGGSGDDTYYVSHAGDVTEEASGSGIDTVFSLTHWTLAAHFENLILLGSNNLAATGNAGVNHLTGNDGNNVLNGLGGGDTMAGGLGNDTYHVDQAGDSVVEAGDAGTDTVRSTRAAYTLTANVEALILVAGSGAVSGTGNALDNTIDGNALANILDGGAGADRMSGGNGDDTYHVDNEADRALEASAAGGDDTVNSSVTFYLPANVETLVLTGSADISGVGNAGANLLQGNSGNNSLDGRGGADVMKGGLGNDGYYVDSALDQVIENAGAGTDTVRSSAAAYTLTSNVENLVLIGSAVSGTGNGLDNVLDGNALANVLDGGGGADVMRGAGGDDTYHVNHPGDVVYEASAGGGNDTVLSSISLVLSAHVEILTLTGAAALNGTGNGTANTINGNGGSNRLSGAGGDDALNGAGGGDTLNGGLGNDTLDGGSGLDSFLFDTVLNSTTNVDDILNFVIADDTILLDRGIFTQAGANGTLAASAFRLGGFAQDADDRILYDPGSGNIFYDADGNGSGTALLFAHVTPGLVLTEADFLIVP